MRELGLDERTDTLLLGECKWTDDPVGLDLLADLENVEPEVRWRGSDRSVVYALFAKAGFTMALGESVGDRDDVYLYTVEDVVGLG